MLLTCGAALLLSVVIVRISLLTPSTPLDNCNVAPAVLTMEWSPNAFVKAANTGVPVIFRHVPPLFQASNWTWQQLQDVAGHLHMEVETSNKPHFFYYDHGVPALLDHRAWSSREIFDTMEKTTRKPETMSLKTFITNIHKPIVVNSRTNKVEEETKYHYLTRTIHTPASLEKEKEKVTNEAAIDMLFGSFMMEYFQPSPLTSSFPQVLSNDSNGTALSLWFGGPRGTTTQSHYDQPHNMFVQLLGSKIFTVLPPCAIDAVYLYPDLHQRARKVQVPLDDITNVEQQTIGMKFPLFKRHIRNAARMTTVVVGPGDILYLPPFWIHGVRVEGDSEGIGAAASANFFINSHVSRLKDQLFQAPLPFNNEWVKSSTAATVTYMWLSSLMKSLSLSLRSITERLVHVRYAHIRLQSEYRYQWDSVGRRCVRDDNERDVGIQIEEMNMQHHVQRFIVTARQIEAAVLWQIMQSYVELVVYSMMGLEEIKAFIIQCILI